MFGRKRKSSRNEKKPEVRLLREFKVGDTVEVSVYQMSRSYKPDLPSNREQQGKK
ncbi:hypothetical protein BCE02nite_12240 [Brevibacillus centrosporus]|jgi:ribosomal protein L21E|uniref:Uncharacterized protein n=1 Tax=Brevibacillus centrosporus TaxID=54910 RepID=A0A1I3V191_9BACL|nr:hypothetical protein BCE02nite_12240 [Brevibacillus centrosporus]SFJ89198.1 hypothetical protein SAMN05518846_106199 [Brevibacillus centrosporus]